MITQLSAKETNFRDDNAKAMRFQEIILTITYRLMYSFSTISIIEQIL